MGEVTAVAGPISVDTAFDRAVRLKVLSLAVVLAVGTLGFWLSLRRFAGESDNFYEARTSLYPVPWYCFCAAICWWPIRQRPDAPRLPLPIATKLLGFGSLSMAIADSIWTALEWRGLDPFPSVADYFYLAYIPIVLAAVILLPTRLMPTVTRSRLVVDGMILLSAIFAFSWYYVLGPTVLAQDKQSPFAKGVAVAYPAGDLLLSACLVFIFLRATDRRLLPIIGLLAGGIVSVLVADSLFLFLSLKGTYSSGNPIDPLWLVSSSMVSLAGRWLSVETSAGRLVAEPERRADVRETGHVAVLRATLPYMLLPMVGSLVMWVATGSEWRGLLALGVYASGGLLVALILVRQFMFIAENLRLMQRIQEDGSELRRLNDELRTAQGELVHSAKMASLGTLSAGVAHELNQPLAIARGIAQQLLAEPDLGTFVRDDLKLIESQTGRMMRIVTHLRTFCRIGGHSREETSINRVIEESFTLLQAQMRSHGIRIECAFDVSNPEVMANANELEQVFLNLFSNAKDALQDVDNARLQVETRVEGDRLVVVVADNGPGFEGSVLERLFEPFFTTKEVGKGTGLGLSISRNLVEKNGGTMSAENAGGARFTLTFPLCVPQAGGATDSAVVNPLA